MGTGSLAALGGCFEAKEGAKGTRKAPDLHLTSLATFDAKQQMQQGQKADSCM